MLMLWPVLTHVDQANDSALTCIDPFDLTEQQLAVLTLVDLTKRQLASIDLAER